jgi:hypothetical protein
MLHLSRSKYWDHSTSYHDPADQCRTHTRLEGDLVHPAPLGPAPQLARLHVEHVQPGHIQPPEKAAPNVPLDQSVEQDLVAVAHAPPEVCLRPTELPVIDALLERSVKRDPIAVRHVPLLEV